MKFSNKFLILFLAFIIFSQTAFTQGFKQIVQGKWGKKTNELGIKFLSPGILPTMPFMSPGGYDVDNEGKIWLADSVNRQIKSFINREWRETMVNSEALGEVHFHQGKLYVISRNPNGFLIFDCEKEKIEKLVKVNFKSPGRIVCLRPNLVVIEEIGGGIWIVEGEKSFVHPAVALQAIGDGRFVYGLQKDILSNDLHLIRVEVSKEPQEPEIAGTYENERRTVYARLVSLPGKTPILSVIDEDDPANYRFINFDQAKNKTLKLPVLDGPYLLSSWKLCSDGLFYGFFGNASEGFKIYCSEKGL